jgi:hypothetical protein
VDPPVGGGLSYSFQRLVGTNRRRKALRRKTMKKKVALFLALCIASAGFAGCTTFPPTSDSWVPVFNSNGGDIWRSWMADLSNIQKFTDKHFLNYDYDDPFNE